MKKVIIFLFIFLLGIIYSWYYLPEKIYESIGHLTNIEFSIFDLSIVTGQKMKVVLSVIFGFVLFYLKSYSVFRRNYLIFFIAFVSVFVGLFVGIFVNSLIFQRKHESIAEVDVRDCLTMWIILPVIVIVLYLVKYFHSQLNSRPRLS